MFESVTELVKRFFLIKSIYIKTALMLFLTASFVNTGLLLFIPGLHAVQYPVFGLIITILSYTVVFCSTIILNSKDEDVKSNIGKFYVSISIISFLASSFATVYFINQYLQEGNRLKLAIFMLDELKKLSTITIGSVILLLIFVSLFHKRKIIKIDNKNK